MSIKVLNVGVQNGVIPALSALSLSYMTVQVCKNNYQQNDSNIVDFAKDTGKYIAIIPTQVIRPY